MKKLKSIISMSMVAVLITSSFTFSASAVTINKDGFSFQLDAYNKTASLVDYSSLEFETTITIPSSVNGYEVVEVADSAFYDYDNANYIVMPYTVESIGNYAFQNCSSLIGVSVPYSVTSMGNYAYYACSSIKKAYVSAQIEKLPDNTFNACSSLEYVSLGSTIKKIGFAAFRDCSSLKTINLDGITEIGEVAFYNSGLTTVTIPETVTEITRLSFANCSALETVTIPETVTSISLDAFKNSSNLTIVGYEGSYAQQYATENNIPFVALPEYENGDVNLDGTVSVDDVTFLQMHIARYDNFVSDDSYKVADFDGNGTIDINDVTMIQLYLAGYVV